MKQEKAPLPAQEMGKCAVFGFAVFSSRDLKLGDFAAPDHAGTSIRSLRDSINALQSMEGFVVRAPSGGKGSIHSGGEFDLKSELQEAIKRLGMDEWGLEYDDFNPSLVDSRPDSVPGLE
jgi:hypothetical protein